METLQIVGIVLAVLGLLELPVALFLLMPRLPPHRAMVTMLAMGASSLTMVALGFALFFGLLP